MQTILEQKGIEKRGEITVKNGYNKSDEYNVLHSNAIGNGDPKGKGTGMGAHTHSTPDSSKPSVINYNNFDTTNGGGLYDIEGKNGIGGRNFLINISKYNKNNEYGAHLIDTSNNDGQIKL
jgi:hypothetical protein